jgi:hypothetical protein
MTKKLRMNEWGPPLYFLKERERFSHDPFKPFGKSYMVGGSLMSEVQKVLSHVFPPYIMPFAHI